MMSLQYYKNSWFMRPFQRFMDWEEPTPKETTVTEFSEVLERIWLWRKPEETLFVIQMFTIMFWMNLLFDTPLIAAACSALATGFFCYTVIERHMARERRMYERRIEEGSYWLIGTLGRCLHFALEFRRQFPGLFCIVVSIAATALWLIGREISTLMFLYILFVVTMILPAIFKTTPPRLAQDFDRGIDEFLPVVNEDNLEVLQRAGEAVDQFAEPVNGPMNAGFDDDDLWAMRMPSPDEVSTDSSDSDSSSTDNETDSIRVIRDQAPRIDLDLSSSDDDDDDSVNLELRDQHVPSENDDSGSDFEIIDANELNELDRA